MRASNLRDNFEPPGTFGRLAAGVPLSGGATVGGSTLRYRGRRSPGAARGRRGRWTHVRRAAPERAARTRYRPVPCAARRPVAARRGGARSVSPRVQGLSATADDVRDSRTRLRSPLNSAPDISAPNRPAEGALGPYLRAIRAHRLLVILGHARRHRRGHRVDRPPAADLPGHREDPGHPARAGGQTFLGLNAVRDAGDPTRTVADGGQADPFLRRGRAHGRQARRRLDPQQGPGRDQRSRRRARATSSRSRPRPTTRPRPPGWPTPSPTRPWRPAAR